ncbi:MAG: hypothetical protein QXN55_03745 [Candidatus Nitrosotenuis sp.]
MKENFSDYILKGLSSDDSAVVLVGTSPPQYGSFWSMYVMFVDAKNGAIIKHVNYDLLVTQENSLIGDKRVPEDIGTAVIIDKKGIRQDHIKGVQYTENFPHVSMDYLFSNDPMNIMITLQGIGVDKKSGPIGDVVMITTNQQSSKEDCKTVELNHAMKNSRILNACYDNTPTLTVQIEADFDDQITIDVPKQIVYSIDSLDCEEGQMIVVMDGETIEPAITSSKSINQVTIDIQKGTHQIEFIGTVPIPNPSPAQYCGVVMGYDTQYLPPKLQLELGMTPELVRCNQGLELAIKASDDSPICITPLTKSKLVERNLVKETIEPASNDDNLKTIPNDYGLEITLDKDSYAIGEKAILNINYVGNEPSDLTIDVINHNYKVFSDTISSTTNTYEFPITDEFIQGEHGVTVTDSNVHSSYIFEIDRGINPPLKEFLPPADEFWRIPRWMIFFGEIAPGFMAWQASHMVDYKHLVESLRMEFIDPTYGPEVFIDRYDSPQTAQEIYDEYVKTHLGSELKSNCARIQEMPKFIGDEATICLRDNMILVVSDRGMSDKAFALLEIILEKIDNTK